MKTDFLRVFAAGALVAIAASLTGSVSAQDIQLASSTDLNNIYARLAELESRAATGNVAYSGGGCDGKVSDDCCEDDCCKAGLIAGGEVLWLKAYNSDGDFGDFNFDDGFRFWIGYQRADALGIRLRYFDFDSVAGNGDQVDSKLTDVEAFDTVQIGCNWDLVVAGGLRYQDLRVDDGGDDFDDITGVGPVVSAELYRHLSDRAALYGIGRQSIVVGNGLVDGGDEEDLDGMVTEFQLGAQLHRERNGALIFGRIGWEAQLYHEPAIDDESVTLMGAVLSGGIMR